MPLANRSLKKSLSEAFMTFLSKLIISLIAYKLSGLFFYVKLTAFGHRVFSFSGRRLR
jgi:flagellar biosynthesis protein FliQ